MVITLAQTTPWISDSCVKSTTWHFCLDVKQVCQIGTVHFYAQMCSSCAFSVPANGSPILPVFQAQNPGVRLSTISFALTSEPLASFVFSEIKLFLTVDCRCSNGRLLPALCFHSCPSLAVWVSLFKCHSSLGDSPEASHSHKIKSQIFIMA